MEAAPSLSFVCPMSWNGLKGDGQTRFCDECGLQVTNLSSLRRKERKTLLERAKTERVCAMFMTHKSGELVTPENPLIVPIKVAAGLAVAASLAGGCRQTKSGGSDVIDGYSEMGMIVCVPESPAPVVSATSKNITLLLDVAGDQVSATRSSDTATFMIRSQSGIGGATLSRSGDKWPEMVLLGTNLKGLESVTFENGSIRCDGSLAQYKNVPYFKPGTEANPIPTGHFDLAFRKWETGIGIEVPAEMLLGNPETIHVKWIDFYR